jgi:hypothetical protein
MNETSAKLIRRLIVFLEIGIMSLSLISPAFVFAEDDLPMVELNADNIAPRPIEDRTSEVVPRDYAHAWQTMVEALERNRTDLLDGYFTGFAKDNLSKLIADQKRTGIRVRYVDHGHKLEALFYAPAGDAMQLRDQARLEVQILDGSKLIHSEQITQSYLVLMTPGADRWLVRDLESTVEPQP